MSILAAFRTGAFVVGSRSTSRWTCSTPGTTGFSVVPAAADCEALADLADVRGDRQAAAELRERHTAVIAAMESLQDEPSGIYRSRRTDTGLPTERLSTMSFYPLLAGVGLGEVGFSGARP
ncbi:MGH1-like glycoside hydrolase domain-containing protein [Nonomuraea basaltis]|uniref:MGH1-like glycoside hydrolase domain-containing protein n=1 Tax=Nonomuraea basaltis TaxID=2495887 RepID=UPI00110C562C|nr:hypothetical protein [Nonomuraea basaltis]TMR96292.1 hypothetical protein EJK15_24365 [Nonomuraea basaltis]